jgi:transcriptional regulator with XRE-family HTH domain
MAEIKPENRAFGEFLRSTREKRGVSASRMSRELGMAWSHLNQIEKGVFGPPREYARLRKMAEILDVPVVEIYRRAGALPDEWLELAREEFGLTDGDIKTLQPRRRGRAKRSGPR